MRYLAGEPIAGIRDWLIEQGVRSSTGSKPGYCFVNSILKSWRYAGVYTWGFEKDAAGDKRLDASGNPIPLVNVPFGIPSIVSVDTKQQCIERLKFGKHFKAKADYHLSGKMVCSACKRLMRGESCVNHAGKEYFRYTCQGQRKACLGVYRKEATEQAIAQSVRDALGKQDIRDLIAEKFVEYRKGKKPEASIEAVRKEIRVLNRQRENLVKAVEDGMPYKDVSERFDEIDRQRSVLDMKLFEYERSEAEITKAEILDMLSLVAEGFKTDGEVINTFISQVILFESMAVAVLRFNKHGSTEKEEIECIMKKYEPAGQIAGSYKQFWLPG